MMMHHHTTFGYKRLSGPEDTVRKKIRTHGQTLYTENTDTVIPIPPSPHFVTGDGGGGVGREGGGAVLM